MDFLTFKKKLLNQEKAVIVEYNNDDLAYQISFMIKKARTVKGLTQAELAEKIGTKQESIARAENGNTLPSISFLAKIADAFNANLIMPMFDFLANDPDIDFYHLNKNNSVRNFNIPEGEFVTPTRHGVPIEHSKYGTKSFFSDYDDIPHDAMTFRYRSI